MSTTTIRTTCGSCQMTIDVPANAIVVELPSPNVDPEAKPGFVHICPGCLSCDSTAVAWRTAAYLLHAGATAMTAPDLSEIQPHYPERRPSLASPMSLDDLIDLHAALNSGAPTF